MPRFQALRAFLLVIAAFGYVADGARTHTQITSGETIRMMVCTPGATKFIDVELSGQTEEITDKCCGDCAPSLPLVPVHPERFEVARVYAPQISNLHTSNVSPSSPLWPGAPPHGPPPYS